MSFIQARVIQGGWWAVSMNPQCILNKESLSRSAYKTRVLLIGMKMCPEACRTLTLFSPRSHGAVFVETQQTRTTRNNEIWHLTLCFFLLQGIPLRALREKDFWATYFLFVFQGEVPVTEFWLLPDRNTAVKLGLLQGTRPLLASQGPRPRLAWGHEMAQCW